MDFLFRRRHGFRVVRIRQGSSAFAAFAYLQQGTCIRMATQAHHPPGTGLARGVNICGHLTPLRLKSTLCTSAQQASEAQLPCQNVSAPSGSGLAVPGVAGRRDHLAAARRHLGVGRGRDVPGTAGAHGKTQRWMTPDDVGGRGGGRENQAGRLVWGGRKPGRGNEGVEIFL